MKAIEKEPLIQEIKIAFAGVSVPSKITLHVAEAHDDYDYENNEKHRLKDHLGSWEDIPEEHFLNCEYAISYLDAAGILYYMPALMTWTLKYYQRNNGTELNMDSTFYALDPNLENERQRAYHESRFSLFSLDQNKACTRFLKYFMEHDPEGEWVYITLIRKVFKDKWHKYDHR